MSGKGSAPRPYSVPKETFDKSFERIFGAKKSETMDSAAGSRISARESMKSVKTKARWLIRPFLKLAMSARCPVIYGNLTNEVATIRQLFV